MELEPVHRGALFVRMAFGAVIGGIVGAFASTLLTAPTLFAITLTAVYLVALVPLSVGIAAIAFAGDRLGSAASHASTVVSVIGALVLGALAILIAEIALDWMRNLLFTAALVGALVFAIGGSLLARRRAEHPRPRQPFPADPY